MGFPRALAVALAVACITALVAVSALIPPRIALADDSSAMQLTEETRQLVDDLPDERHLPPDFDPVQAHQSEQGEARTFGMESGLGPKRGHHPDIHRPPKG